MKICWDNLEKLEYRCDRNQWQHKKYKATFYVYRDFCKNCGEPFLTSNKGKYCDLSCSSSDNQNGRKHSDETKIKIGKSRKYFISEETKKKMSESHKGLFEGDKHPLYGLISGENNPNWKGGISNNPYCPDWNILKKELKESDGNTCQNTLCEGRSQRMTSHHIDYNKQHCHPINIITLCNSCNSRANGNRDWWQNLYTQLKGE